MSGDKRFYQEKPVPLDPRDIGHKLQIAGMVFQGEGETVIIMTPGSHGFNACTTQEHPLTILDFDTQGWANVLAASDDPQFYDRVGKAWHRKARYQISGVVQQKIWARDDFKCQFCGRKMGDVQLTIDHWIPLELGGANDTTNYISACRSCNKKKGALHPHDFCRKIGLSDIEYDILDRRAQDIF